MSKPVANFECEAEVPKDAIVNDDRYQPLLPLRKPGGMLFRDGMPFGWKIVAVFIYLASAIIAFWVYWIVWALLTR